jgi:hypothetical protein
MKKKGNSEKPGGVAQCLVPDHTHGPTDCSREVRFLMKWKFLMILT